MGFMNPDSLNRFSFSAYIIVAVGASSAPSISVERRQLVTVSHAGPIVFLCVCLCMCVCVCARVPVSAVGVVVYDCSAAQQIKADRPTEFLRTVVFQTVESGRLLTPFLSLFQACTYYSKRARGSIMCWLTRPIHIYVFVYGRHGDT